MLIKAFIFIFFVINFDRDSFCEIRFSSRIKNQNSIVVYKGGLAFQKTPVFKLSEGALGDSYLSNQNQYIPREGKAAPVKNANPKNKIPLDESHLEYSYTLLKDGFFELENGINLNVKNGKPEITGNTRRYNFDSFFKEKNPTCNDIKFDFIYNNVILKKQFFGNYYQLYIPYHFEPVYLILIQKEKAGVQKIYHLIASAGKDFSCHCGGKFYDYSYIRDFAENQKAKEEIIKKESSKIISHKQKIENKIKKNSIELNDKIDMEKNFKIAFFSISNASVPVVREESSRHVDMLDGIDTFDQQSIAFASYGRKNAKPMIKKYIFEIENCLNINILENSLTGQLRLLNFV